jgi:hypothetical protein
MIYLYIYILLTCFLTGYTVAKEEILEHKEQVVFNITVVLFSLLVSPLIYGFDLIKTYGGKLLHELDLLLQIKFYWVYYRGGFYNMDDQRLRNADIHVFKLDYNNKRGLKHKHLRHVYGLIFKRNNYTRRNWRVVDNMVEEVQ